MIAMLGAREMVFLLGGLALLALLVLGGLAFAAIKILGKRQGGETLAGVTGCAIAAGLGCLGLCVLLGFGLIAAFVFAARVADRAIDHLPPGRWRLEHHETIPLSPRWHSEARLVFRATGEHFDTAAVLGLVHDVAGDDLGANYTSGVDGDGTTRHEIEFKISAEGEELRRIDDEIARRIGELNTVEGVKVEYLGVRRDA